VAKFKAGDMIITTDDEGSHHVYMVNGIIDGTHYSLDNGNGFIDARATIASIDDSCTLCD